MLNEFPSTVLFDLDGTLIDSLPDVAAALNFALGRSTVNELKLDDVRAMIGQGAEPMIRLALDLIDDPEESDSIELILKRFLDRYSEYPNVLTEVYPGVRGVLEGLKSANVKLGICTNKPSLTTKTVIAALDLEKYFNVILCGDQVVRQKPNGAHVIDLLNKLGADNDNAVLVGDSDNDIDAARNANIPSVAVSYGYSVKPIRNLGADAVVDKFEDLPEVLKNMFVNGR